MGGVEGVDLAEGSFLLSLDLPPEVLGIGPKYLIAVDVVLLVAALEVMYFVFGIQVEQVEGIKEEVLLND